MKYNDNERLMSLLEAAFIDADNKANSFISIIKQEGGKVCVNSNSAGLLRLSYLLAKLALGEKEGNHIHIDEASEADSAEVGLVVCYKSAPWEG